MIQKCVFCIIKRGDKFLLLDSIKHNEWSLIGGKVEPNDYSNEYAMVRELFEEVISGVNTEYEPEYYLELNIERITHFIQRWHSEFFDCVIYYLNDSKEFITFENKEPEKHKEIKWMTIDEITLMCDYKDVLVNYMVEIHSCLDEFVERKKQSVCL